MNNEILDAPEIKTVKNPIFKIKHVIIIFIIGWIITLFGGLFKIQSWDGGSLLIMVGVGIKVLSGLLGIIKLLTIKEVRSFLNC